MNSYSKFASLMAKNRCLLRNTVALGGLFTILVIRDEEIKEYEPQMKIKLEPPSFEGFVANFFPTDLFRSATFSDFDPHPSKQLHSIRQQEAQRKIRETSSEKKLGCVYNVEWTRPLGEGGFGAVYLCKDKRTGALAALKQISKQYTNDSSFQREMDAFLHIRKSGGHPNICGLRENFEEGEFYYLVLDLIKGGEMFDHLVKDGAYSEADAARLVREVGSALSFLHGIGLVHTDLKPENLMLSSENSSDAVIKVVDFGCAQIIDKNSPYYNPNGNQSFSNTPGYSPPEIIDCTMRPIDLDPSVDMFSIGVIIYIMLTGVHPFDISGGSTDNQMNQRILRNCMPPLQNSPITAHLSQSAIELIGKLLDWNPKTRMTALEMLNHPWVKGETATTGKITNSEKKLKAFRKYKSGLEAQVFASMVQYSDGSCYEDDTKKISLIERSFQTIDAENRGYITTKDLKRLDAMKGHRTMEEKGGEEESQLSLSGFSNLLSEHMKNVYFSADHIVFKEGDEGDSMFFINSGRVEVTTDEGFKAIIEQGDFFGEGVLLNKHGKRSATVKCITPLHGIEIGRNYFEKYVAEGFETELTLLEIDRLRRQDRAKAILGLQDRLNSDIMKNGDYVYKQWEKGDDIFLLEGGVVDIDVNGHCVYTVQAGELFGEYAMIFGRPRNTSARCVSDQCKIDVMELKDFEGIMKSNSSIRDGLRDVVLRREFKKALVYATENAFPSTENELKEAFERIDVDGSGYIDLAEIRVLLRRMDESLTDNDIAQILNSLDLDGAGKIHWSEFKRIFWIRSTTP